MSFPPLRIVCWAITLSSFTHAQQLSILVLQNNFFLSPTLIKRLICWALVLSGEKSVFLSQRPLITRTVDLNDLHGLGRHEQLYVWMNSKAPYFASWQTRFHSITNQDCKFISLSFLLVLIFWNFENLVLFGLGMV